MNRLPEDPRWTAYLLNELSPEAKEEAERELEQDPSLYQAVEELRATLDLLSGALAEPVEGADQMLWNHRTLTPPKKKSGKHLALWFPTAIAAMLAVGLGLNHFLFQGETEALTVNGELFERSLSGPYGYTDAEDELSLEVDALFAAPSGRTRTPGFEAEAPAPAEDAPPAPARRMAVDVVPDEPRDGLEHRRLRVVGGVHRDGGVETAPGSVRGPESRRDPPMPMTFRMEPDSDAAVPAQPVPGPAAGEVEALDLSERSEGFFQLAPTPTPTNRVDRVTIPETAPANGEVPGEPPPPASP